MSDITNSGFKNTEKPLFELEISPGVQPLAPRTLDELQLWLDTERTYWDWLGQSPANNIQEIRSRQTHGEGECANQLHDARDFLKREDMPSFEAMLRSIQSHLTGRYRDMRALHSTSPQAKFLESIPNQLHRGYALRYFMRLGLVSPSGFDDLLGWTLACNFDHGVTPSVAKYNELAFTQLLDRINAEHGDLRKNAGMLQDQFTEHSAHISALHTDQRVEFVTAQSTRETAFQSLVANSTETLTDFLNKSAENLANIEETYNKKLALQVAVTYLKEKAESHQNIALYTGIASLLIGAGFVLAAIGIGSTILSGDKPAWHNVAVAALGATLWFWFLRILVRMFLSNLHLATDTKSRSVLMQTYLALLREGGGLKDSDKELILKILFRPFSDGMVRDDAVPPGLWDTVTKGLGR